MTCSVKLPYELKDEIYFDEEEEDTSDIEIDHNIDWSFVAKQTLLSISIIIFSQLFFS